MMDVPTAIGVECGTGRVTSRVRSGVFSRDRVGGKGGELVWPGSTTDGRELSGMVADMGGGWERMEGAPASLRDRLHRMAS